MTIPKKSTLSLDAHLLKRLAGYLKERWILTLSTVILMLLSNIVHVLQPYLFKIGIDNSVNNGDISFLHQVTLALIGLLVSGFILTFTFNYSIQKLGQILVKNIRLDIAKKIFCLSKNYFDRNPTGKLLTLLSNDVESIRDFIAKGVVSIIADFVIIFFTIGIMLYISVPFTMVILVVVPIFAMVTYAFKVALRKGYQGVRSSNAKMNTILAESITGIKEIFLFNHQKKTFSDFEEANQNYKKSFYKIVQSYSLYFPSITAASSLSMIGILCITHFFLKQTISIGDIFAFFIYIDMLFRPLRDLAEQFNTLQSAMSSSERIFAFFDQKEEFQERLTENDFTAPKNNFTKKLRGNIHFDNVTFGYKKNKPILKNVTFSIASGERVAIVGRTGAGKSTIISLLPRLYDIDSGQIKIDGKNIKNMDLTELRNNISIIPQNVFLFTESFRKNIELAEKKPEKIIMEAAEKSLIKDIFMERAKKLDAPVLEEGKSLSTGQKQLLAFAQTFVKDSPIVILDEATANIDSDSEKKIEKALDVLLENRTAIIIAHRFSTIKKVDRIIVMHEGQIVEEGSHKELLKIKNGLYKKLYTMQNIQLKNF